MKIGFTGTRNGMTMRQAEEVREIIVLHLMERENEAHHGDCVGSDDQFHHLVRQYCGAKIVSHPGYSMTDPTSTVNRAFCDADEIREAKQHFARNRDIVNETDLLIATPPAKPLPASGGTAYTINYARKVGKPVTIIYPDGSIE